MLRCCSRFARVAVALVVVGLSPGISHAFTIELQTSDFSSQLNVYSGVTSFTIAIEVLGPLVPGVYANPALGDIEYLVRGSLDPTTPARTANPAFTSFAVDDRGALSGQDFYDLGNSLHFEISASADLSDGLQVSELVGTGLVFEFDGRELGTGRYHPPIFQLSSDGTGLLRNAANTGGINPFTGVEVNATAGDEYITELSFTPASLTLAVPEPGSAGLLAPVLAALAAARRPRTH